MVLTFIDNVSLAIDSVSSLLVTIVSYVKSFLLFGQEGFLNLLNFLNYFFFDFLFDSLSLFEFLPPVFNFSFTILFYFIVVTFILKLLKLLPFV